MAESQDMLRQIFDKQEELNRMLGVHTAGMAEADQVKWLLNYSRAMTQEIAELIDSVPWKWWAKYQTFDRQNARVEVVDLLHFLVSAAQVLGMSADDVFELYIRKHQVNQDRQKDGYQSKNEDDSRHL